ncbi:MarR family winged helix-turn-helix transcriptional regulator [Amycolatopsis anabasis]|uniref:MarR family winged helix-turn-helix transcriptional regulator n=1 Tax=Amycolatopsis anabasis TaxID=1840409 RepID=UPI00131C2191|nr:MarR family transcriptional regulator [Amycolatopsis anabasis]
MDAEAKFEQAVSWRVGHSVKLTEQALMVRKTEALRDVGLTVPQYAAMFVLSIAPGVSGAQIARLVCVTQQSMASMLSSLEKRGLIQRKPNALHSHVLETRLTRSGSALLRKADKLATGIERDLVDEFTADEAEQLHSLLERARKRLHG